eukprot:CAMPEP_0184646762 /NCGR_PEP_ID=MMETSP0308-20130426/3533_1 /TAXON_ID=38269 /ORGANISM="Gloeochaete witrockiana, Strain SAG 46.84" /LENGTH=154 /DNA_ID=CAMNT_0027077095 /DNA_START=9 /DNA_END=473 /DNA_ORIENTATION=-
MKKRESEKLGSTSFDSTASSSGSGSLTRTLNGGTARTARSAPIGRSTPGLQGTYRGVQLRDIDIYNQFKQRENEFASNLLPANAPYHFISRMSGDESIFQMRPVSGSTIGTGASTFSDQDFAAFAAWQNDMNARLKAKQPKESSAKHRRNLSSS